MTYFNIYSSFFKRYHDWCKPYNSMETLWQTERETTLEILNIPKQYYCRSLLFFHKKLLHENSNLFISDTYGNGNLSLIKISTCSCILIFMIENSDGLESHKSIDVKVLYKLKGIYRTWLVSTALDLMYKVVQRHFYVSVILEWRMMRCRVIDGHYIKISKFVKLKRVCILR